MGARWAVAGVLLVVLGCRGQIVRPSWSVYVEVQSFARPTALNGKTYVLLSGSEAVSEHDLRFQEVARHVHAALQYRGFQPARPGELPHQVVMLIYGMGSPETRYWTSPILQQTDPKNNPLRFGVTGSRLHSQTTVTRFLSLLSLDIRSKQEPEHVWRVDVQSTGTSQDLRAIASVLAAATRDYIARDSRRLVPILVASDGPTLTWARKARPAVPAVVTVDELIALARSKETENTGSGGSCFVVHPDGLVATNAHVVGKHSRVRVFHYNLGRWFVVKRIKRDEQHDLAILDLGEKIPDFLPIAPPNKATPGTRVFTYGFPAPEELGVEPKFTDGSISSITALGKADVYQITVPVQPGNSGGPLLTERGMVVGVVTARYKDSAFYAKTRSLPQNINFAVSSEHLHGLLDWKAPIATLTDSREEAIALARRSICMVEATE